MVFDMVDRPRIHKESYISIFRSLPAWKVLHILCVSRASSWSLRGRWRFLRGVLVVFEMVDASRIYQGSHISIFKSVTSWKVVQLLGRPHYYFLSPASIFTRLKSPAKMYCSLPSNLFSNIKKYVKSLAIYIIIQ